MSVSYFQRRFKEEEGIAPNAYLSDLRLEKAREMLADPNCFLQIQEIAFRVGLKNSSHFTQDFKAKNGKTPTEYRDHHDGLHQSDSPMDRNDSFGQKMMVLDKR